MKYLRIVIFLFILISLGCKEDEPVQSKQWYKGNLHTHSYWSDGNEFPEVIMEYYKSNDYQFIALSDHNILAAGEKWKVISEDSLYMNAFNNYLNSYGEDWVNYKIDSLGRTQVKLKTYDEYRTHFEESEKFLILQSEEISDDFEGKPLHLNATNVQELIPPQGGNSLVQTLQNNIDAVHEQKNALGIPMLVHINHPNFHYAITVDDMIALRDERFFEVYNGHNHVRNSGDSTHMSTENMWDQINIAYVLANKPLMYGMATDDSHNYHRQGRKWSNAGRGWVNVHADALTPKSLIEAMESGEFYASTGVELTELENADNTLSVDVKSEPGVTYKISFIGCRKGEIEPEVLFAAAGNTASFEVTEDFLYVRSKVVSSKLHSNPIEDLIYETAWTQPVLPSRN